ncbi:MAG: DUF29 domain-containing protein [Methylococcaceae bacterium]|nr:DUF29 domain-containing protein [Methylococcaceae bacterium]
MINYERDFYGWTQEQAGLLRNGRLHDLDVENLLEEIEAMGRSEKRELQSRLTVLLIHLLKWHYQPNRRGRSWQLTLKSQRMGVVQVINDNPGLKSKLNQCFVDAYNFAVIGASNETGIDEAAFCAECPWTIQQVIDQTFFPD